MIPNFLKVMYRSITNNRLFTMLNLAGLLIGVTSFIVIIIYIQNELTYDKHNVNANRIMLLQQLENSATTGGRFATDFKSYFTGIEKTVRLQQSNPLITADDNAFYESNFYFADSTILSVFTFTLLQGNSNTSLKENYGVLVSETTAKKMFPNQNAVGRNILYNGKHKLHITGIFKDLPSTAHVHIDFLANYSNANELIGWDVTNNYWAGNTLTYLLLSPATKPESIETRFPAYISTLNDPNAAVWKLHLIPLRDVYLHTSLIASSPVTYVYIFSIVGLLILALACFNYINLATARASSRAKEVGVRKVMGASLSQLRFQFLGETAFFITLAVLFSLIITSIGLPYINRLTDKSLSLASVFTFEGLAIVVTGIALISLLAGSYPAFILSTHRAATVLKGEAVHGSGKAWFRKTLVVVQFTVSITMIIATIIVFEQMQYIKNKNIGYARAQIISLDMRDATPNTKTFFKQQVSQLTTVASATIAYGLPGTSIMAGQKLISDYVPNNAKDASIKSLNIDEDYLKTFDIKIVEGRGFDPNRTTDKNAYLINESARRYFGWKEIINKQTGYYTFSYKPDGSYEEIPRRGDVIGVIADYNHNNLKFAVEPMIISLNQGWEAQIAIKLKPGNIAAAISQIEQLWKKNFAGKPFEFSFMDDAFNRTYQSETKTGQVFGLFAVVAILISCLGLFGLITFAAQRRKKEIGIRKVLGAGVAQIVQLLSTDFLQLIIVSSLLAFPIAWYSMQKWLQVFAYRIAISWYVFAVALLMIFLMALITISFQAINAAIANPVKSLRSE